MQNTFAILKCAALVPSTTNPRTIFDPAWISELALSIQSTGVIQPILVRPLPGHRVADTDRGVTHEIVEGECRWRGSSQGGVDTIPSMIRDLTDTQVMEIQLISFLKRKDLTALEEAQGYEQLMAAAPMTANELADRIKRSRSYVFGRLKLLDLSFECQQAMRAGQIDASRALLIARIPDTTLQTKALAEATRVDYRGEVCSLRAFASWLQANVMLKLDRAAFNISDSQLIPATGNCTTCPKRTGANPDLFADVQSVDICTDPACFQAKTAGHRANIVATAEKRGMTLIDGDDAVDICDPDGDYIDGYSPLTQVREDTIDGQPRLLGALLGDDAPAPVLIENPWTRELIAAVPTDEAEAMLLARGLVKAAGVKAAKKDDIEGDIKRLQDKMQKEITKRFREDAFEVLADVLHDCDDVVADKLVCGGLLRAWWLRKVGEMRATDIAKVFGLYLMKPEDSKTTGGVQDAQTTQVRLHVQRCDSASLYQALALFMVLDDCPDFYSEPCEPTLLNALAKEVGVDLDEMASDTRYTVQDEYAAELKKLKAQLKGSTGHDVTTPAFRGPNGETWTGRGQTPRWLAVLVQAGQDKESFRVTDQVKVITPEKSPITGTPAAQAKGRGGKKPKTTEAEAKAQIAAAMQAQEETNPGADAQGIDGANEQPVATSAADASGVAQAGFVAAWPMGVAA
jgi:ParB/RepB/Spo0J family partition protein